MSDWRPSAPLASLERRADLLARIRSFFAARGLMEVDPPLLGGTGVPDLHIEGVEARVGGEPLCLQSSPEYFLKRLLAAGSGPVYFLGKVFRDGEWGRRHRPEFTLLEWYRPGWDEGELIGEIEALIRSLIPGLGNVSRFTYRELFRRHLDTDPHLAAPADLQALAQRHCGGYWGGEDRAVLLDLLFSTVVEPQLPDGLVFVEQYPVCQAALAQVASGGDGVSVARRFEVFLDRIEIGNGYYELADPGEQRRRFEADNAARQSAGRRPVKLDERLLAALRAGLPPCAGVALGVDRLLMGLLGEADISRVIPFDPGG